MTKEERNKKEKYRYIDTLRERYIKVMREKKGQPDKQSYRDGGTKRPKETAIVTA